MTVEWESDPLDAPDGRAWDLLVVGGGTAGLVGAQTAAALGASTVLVERDRPGGDCLWTGCVPSKALLAAAHAAAGARSAGRLGVHVDGVRVDFGAVCRHVRDAVAAIEPDDSPETVRRSGARVARGSVRFTGPGEATVDGSPVRFRQALVATGSAPVVPDLPGLAACAPLTSESVWEVEELPGRLLVVGGGPVGCELGQAFARLGSRVTLVEQDRLLPQEHPDASRLVTEALVADGVDVRTGRSLRDVAPAAEGWTARLDGGDAVGFDRVLVATGRRPRTAGLGLDRIGVRLDEAGHVVVDGRMRTSDPRVWAAGDVTGLPPFTHTAGVHASLAASNAVLGLRRTTAPDRVPRVTWTQPEVASFGAPAGTPGTTRHRVDHGDVDRAVAEGRTAGFTELVLDRRGRVAGATLVGPRAGETVSEAVLAAATEASTSTLTSVMHPYPAWSYGLWDAAIAHYRGRLGSPTSRRAVGALVAARRRWVDRRA